MPRAYDDRVRAEYENLTDEGRTLNTYATAAFIASGALLKYPAIFEENMSDYLKEVVAHHNTLFNPNFLIK